MRALIISLLFVLCINLAGQTYTATIAGACTGTGAANAFAVTYSERDEVSIINVSGTNPALSTAGFFSPSFATSLNISITLDGYAQLITSGTASVYLRHYNSSGVLQSSQLVEEHTGTGALSFMVIDDFTIYDIASGDYVTIGLYLSGTIGDVDMSFDATVDYSNPLSANDILTFTLPNQTGAATINAIDHTVGITVAHGTNLGSMGPTITVSSGASISPTSGTLRVFTSPVTYTVTAQDTTEQVWTVTITEAARSVVTHGRLLKG
jgi:hypothetical protein